MKKDLVDELREIAQQDQLRERAREIGLALGSGDTEIELVVSKTREAVLLLGLVLTLSRLAGEGDK